MAERRKNHTLELVVHVLTIFVLLLKGFDKMTHHHLVSGGTLVILGFAIAALMVVEKRLNLPHHKLKQACLVIEATALFIVAVVFYKEGRVYLPYVFGGSALAYVFAALMAHRAHASHTP